MMLETPGTLLNTGRREKLNATLLFKPKKMVFLYFEMLPLILLYGREQLPPVPIKLPRAGYCHRCRPSNRDGRGRKDPLGDTYLPTNYL
jgi:hypothetical protein